MTAITHAEWLAQGESLFGKDLMNWKFVCPSCGHVASPLDFKAFKDRGANPNSATIECIGRYFPKDERGGWSEDHCNPKVKSPCDYAGYGLIGLAPLSVKHEDGKATPCFAFAKGA